MAVKNPTKKIAKKAAAKAAAKATKRVTKKIKRPKVKSGPKANDLIDSSKDATEKIKDQLNRINKGEPLLKDQPATPPADIETETVDITTSDAADTNTPPAAESTPAANPLDNVKEDIGEFQEPAAEPSKKPIISLFDDVKKPTEQDQDQISKLESMVTDTFDDDTFGEPEAEEDTEEQRKVNAKTSAGIWVVVIDVGMMMLCLFLSNDYSNESQRKFSLIPERKNAIKQAIYQILLKSKKKTNPYMGLILAVFGSYAPMILIAIVAGRNQKKKMQEQRARTASRYEGEPIPREGIPLEKYDNKDIVSNLGGGGINTGSGKPRKKGRHKKGCSFYDDNNTCNCQDPNFVRPKDAKG